MAQVNAGRVRFVSRGEYNNSTQYYLFDLVDYNGSSYFAKANTTGNVPTNTTYWQLVAEKGNTGGDGPTGPTGNGIASIAKTSSAGLIDTYTITYTNGTTSTFEITNGADGEVTQEYVDEHDDELRTLFNVLPKVSGTGESVTLNNTGDTMLYKMDLKGNTSQEVVSGEVGLEVEDTSIYVDDVNEDKENYITLKGNTYQDSTQGNQLIDFANPVSISSAVTCSFQNNILSASGTGTYISAFWNITSLYKANAGKTLKFGFKQLSNVTGSGTVVQINVSYNDGTANQYLPMLGRGGTLTNRQIPNDVSNVQDVLFGIYPNNQRPAEAGSVTIEEPLLYFDNNNTYEPYTNGASPNPDYPQDIEVVTGNNSIKVEGKNILDYSNFIAGRLDSGQISYQSDSSIGTITDNSIAFTTTKNYRGITTNNYINVKPNQTYYCNIDNNFDNVVIAYYDDNKNFISQKAWRIQSNSFETTPNNAYYIRLYLYLETASTVTLTNLQLTLSSTATPYEAYKGQTYEVNLGKNLFDISKVINGTWNNPESTSRIILYLDKVKKGTTISVTNNGTSGYRFATGFTRLGYPDTSNVMVNESGYITSSTYTITADNDGYPFLQITKLNNTNISPSEVTGLFQIEKSDTPTSYAPYFTPIELCKIGTYQDRIYKSNGNWYLHKEIGKNIINTNNVSIKDIYTNIDYAIIPKSSDDIAYDEYWNRETFKTNVGTVMISPSWNNSDNVGKISGSAEKPYYWLGFTKGTTLEVIKTKLSNANALIYYVLSTPTDTQITDTTLVNQLNALYNATIYSTTHINTETSNLLPYIDLKYNVITPAPSPDRASEVEVVKGNNTITISNEDGTKTQTFNVNLGNLEFCKIGNYQDYIYYDKSADKWYKYGAIGKVVLDGTNVSASIRREIANSKYGFCFNYDNAYKSQAGEIGNILCNKLKNKTRDEVYNNTQGIAVVSPNDFYGTGCFIYVEDTSTMSLNDFNTWLASNNMIVYYRLATSTTTEITNSTLIAQLNELKKAMSYYDKTLITQTNASKPFILDVVAIRDLQDIFELISGE